MRFFEHHLGARLRLALFALAIPLAVTGAVLIWQDYNARHDAIITQVNLKSAQVNAQLEDFVHRADAATAVKAINWVSMHSPSVTDPTELDMMNSYLVGFANKSPQFTEAHATDATGCVIASSDPSVIGTRVGDGGLFERARSTGVFTASDVIVPSERAFPFTLFLQPLEWDSGSPEGFLVAQSELSTISGALDMSIGFPETARSGIFDSKGRILAGTGYEAPHPGLAAGRDISESAVWAQAATRPTAEWFGPGLDNVPRIIFFSYPDSTPWVTTVAYAQSELFGPLWKRLWTFIGVLAVTLAATVLVGELLIRRDRKGVEALERDRVTLDAVINGATDGVMVIDNTGSVNFLNRRLGEMIGVNSESLRHQRLKPESTEGGCRVSVLKRQEGAPVLLG